MVNKPKIKGTVAETAFVDWLRDPWFPYAERRSLQGSLDKGDVTGCPGLVFEVKDWGRWSIPAWLRETEQERVNAGADYGILIMKPPLLGLRNPGLWAAAMYKKDLVRLLSQVVNLENAARLDPHFVDHVEVSGARLDPHFVDHVEVSGAAIGQFRRSFRKHLPEQLAVIKPRSKADEGNYYAVCRAYDLLVRLNLAGYGEPGSWLQLPR